MFPLHTQFVEVRVTPIHHKLQPPEYEIFCVASSIIWNCRNKLIFEDKVLSSVGLWSKQLPAQWNSWRLTRVASARSLVARWSPLSSNTFFKLNIAISQSKSSCSASLGLIIWNLKGKVVAASCEIVNV